MRIQTFESSTNDAVVSMSGFLDTYEDNIRQSIIPSTQLPIYLTYYATEISPPTAGDILFTTVCLVPTNQYSKRIWHLQVQGHLKQDVQGMEVLFRFPENTVNEQLDTLFLIGFEGPLSGTMIVNGKVLDASIYWTYLYTSDVKTLNLRFTNPSGESSVDTSNPLTLFTLQLSIENVILTSCKPQSIPYPPDNIRNVYCIHNSDPTGALGGFAVSGDIVYRDYGQNFRLSPTFLGSRYKLLFTLTYADNSPIESPTPQIEAFMGSIFDLQYVGGGMGNVAYVTFENKTQERVCVWMNPTVPADDPQDRRAYTFVDPGRNTVGQITLLSNIFRWFDGQYDPCLPFS